MLWCLGRFVLGGLVGCCYVYFAGLLFLGLIACYGCLVVVRFVLGVLVYAGCYWLLCLCGLG